MAGTGIYITITKCSDLVRFTKTHCQSVIYDTPCCVDISYHVYHVTFYRIHELVTVHFTCFENICIVKMLLKWLQ